MGFFSLPKLSYAGRLEPHPASGSHRSYHSRSSSSSSSSSQYPRHEGPNPYHPHYRSTAYPFPWIPYPGPYGYGPQHRSPLSSYAPSYSDTSSTRYGSSSGSGSDCGPSCSCSYDSRSGSVYEWAAPSQRSNQRTHYSQPMAEEPLDPRMNTAPPNFGVPGPHGHQAGPRTHYSAPMQHAPQMAAPMNAAPRNFGGPQGPLQAATPWNNPGSRGHNGQPTQTQRQPINQRPAQHNRGPLGANRQNVPWGLEPGAR